MQLNHWGQIVSRAHEEKKSALKKKDLRKTLNKIELDDWFNKNLRAVDTQKQVDMLKTLNTKNAKGIVEKMETRVETTTVDPIFLKAYGV